MKRKKLLEKIKAALEFLDDTDLKIITSIFFEKVTNKDMAAQLNVSKEFIVRHKRESTEKIADIMYGHLVGSNFSSSYLQDWNFDDIEKTMWSGFWNYIIRLDYNIYRNIGVLISWYKVNKLVYKIVNTICIFRERLRLFMNIEKL